MALIFSKKQIHEIHHELRQFWSLVKKNVAIKCGVSIDSIRQKTLALFLLEFLMVPLMVGFKH